MPLPVPGIGIKFDIDELGTLGLESYGYTACRIFMTHVDPSKLPGCIIMRGDTRSTLSGSTRQFCIAIYGITLDVDYIKNVFGELESPALVHTYRRFIEKPQLDSEPLSEYGRIDALGALITPSWDIDDHKLCKQAGWRYNPKDLDDNRSVVAKAQPRPTASLKNKMTSILRTLFGYGKKEKIATLSQGTMEPASEAQIEEKIKVSKIEELIHHIGESYGGGIVFYVDDSGQHGLIAATSDQGTGMRWDDAVQICANYEFGGHDDWYLPSHHELTLLYMQRSVVGGLANRHYYWSSTESNSYTARSLCFANGSQDAHGKANTAPYVRAVRAF